MIRVYYHGGCQDGIAAAVAAYCMFGDSATYDPLNYFHRDPELPDDTTEVYFVDFSPSRTWLDAQTLPVYILDHHVTAQAALLGLPNVIFDMQRSGAMIAWQYFHPDTEVPPLFHYVQDRDLWHWKLPHSREISEYLMSRKKDLSTWVDLLDQPLESFIDQGALLIEVRMKFLRAATKMYEIFPVGTFHVPVVNCTAYPSEVCEYLLAQPDLAEYPFVVTYNREQGHWRLSFRSREYSTDQFPTSFNVATIAQAYGGGGHQTASGAEVKELPWDAVR